VVLLEAIRGMTLTPFRAVVAALVGITLWFAAEALGHLFLDWILERLAVTGVPKDLLLSYVPYLAASILLGIGCYVYGYQKGKVGASPGTDLTTENTRLTTENTNLVDENRRLTNENADLVTENTSLQGQKEKVLADFHNQIEQAEAILKTLYSEYKDQPRFNIYKNEATYVVGPNGDVEATRIYEIKCAHAFGHFWVIYIEADPESAAVSSVKDSDLSVTDATTGAELNWLVTLNEPRKKKIAIFFPELKKDEVKAIRIKYKWPRLYGRLIDEASVRFTWRCKSFNNQWPASVKFVWEFQKLGHVFSKAIGVDQKLLRSDHTSLGVRWTYENTEEITDNTERAIRFSRMAVYPPPSEPSPG
jgi:hypothetical protein